MNVPEYIKLAKAILKEDAGSEGMVYEIAAKSGLKTIEHDLFKIEEIKTENGISKAKATFVYPQDYGFALNTIKEALEDIQIISLSLVY